MKYYNTETKTEVIKGYHDIFVPAAQVKGEKSIRGTKLLPNIVAISDNHIFMQPMPKGKVFTYIDGVPSGYMDAPVILPTNEQKLLKLEQSITPRNLREAALGDEFALNKIASIDYKINILRNKQ